MVAGFSLNAVIYFEKKSGKKNAATSYTMKDFYLQFKEPAAIIDLPNSFSVDATSANKKSSPLDAGLTFSISDSEKKMLAHLADVLHNGTPALWDILFHTPLHARPIMRERVKKVIEQR